MAARAYRQGQIRFCIGLDPGRDLFRHEKRRDRSFRQIHELSGKRIHYEKVVDGIGTVDPGDIRKGFEYEKGEYVLLDEAEIEGVKLESKKTLELTQFVDADVRHAAVQLHDLLGEMGLRSFAMASGGKGVHVVVPLDGKADWPAVKISPAASRAPWRRRTPSASPPTCARPIARAHLPRLAA
ncbi:MAG: repair protein [Sphingomonas bacterium]|jgi:hypothetical protein|nr:repair protein [Sphingomonas bacterium]